MRLICPRCGAQYEIDGSAIPAAGRDVECSACDHVWRAMPPAESFDPEARPQLSRPLSDSVIEILREEAARELENRAAERRSSRAAERAAEVAAEISQPLPGGGVAENTFFSAASAVAADEAAGNRAPPVRDDDAAAASPSEDQVPRRIRPFPPEDRPADADLHSPPPLRTPTPAIDIAPTLARQPVTPPAAPPRKRESDARGYRAGFLIAVMVAVAAVGLYALGPHVADQGAVGATLAEWRVQVDRGRDWLSSKGDAAADSLRGTPRSE